MLISLSSIAVWIPIEKVRIAILYKQKGTELHTNYGWKICWITVQPELDEATNWSNYSILIGNEEFRFLLCSLQNNQK